MVTNTFLRSLLIEIESVFNAIEAIVSHRAREEVDSCPFA